MKISELFESKTKRKEEMPKPRNWVAKNAKTSGAGSHNGNKFSRKEKHKNKPSKLDQD